LFVDTELRICALGSRDRSARERFALATASAYKDTSILVNPAKIW
jgi:hypothetical protein